MRLYIKRNDISTIIKILLFFTFIILLFSSNSIAVKSVENSHEESFYFEYKDNLFTIKAHKVEIVHFFKMLEAASNIEIFYDENLVGKTINYEINKKSKEYLVKDILNKLYIENYMLIFNKDLYKLYLIKRKTGHEKDILNLIADLSSQEKKEKAFEKLKAMGVNSISVLKDKFPGSSDRTKEYILDIIDSIDDSGIKEILSIALKDNNKYIRKKSLNIVSKKAKSDYFSEKEVKQLIFPLLNDPSDFIKGEAALSLSRAGIKEAIIPINTSLKKLANTDSDIRENTDIPESHSMKKSETLLFYYIDSLLQQKAEAVPILNILYTKESEKNDYKYILAYILTSAGEKMDVNTLVESLRYCSIGRIRANATFQLGEIGNHNVIESLKEALSDNYMVKTKEGVIYPVRNNAKEALEKIIP